jgi:hypothetical protein
VRNALTSTLLDLNWLTVSSCLLVAKVAVSAISFFISAIATTTVPASLL